MNKKLVLPKENLFRAAYSFPPAAAGDEPVRAVTTPATGDGRTLQLQWSVFDRWTEIDSWYEGNFIERIAPGAAKKTIRESRQGMRILLQHGRDPSIGEKPIAPIDVVEENDIGGYAEGRLFDGLDPLVVDGLRAGQYGASFRFKVMREEIVEDPGVSDYNPKGLPERTIKEMAVSEFGPVTWGAYGDATAGVRSITDEIHFGIFRDMPPEKLVDLAQFWNTGRPSVRLDVGDMDIIAEMLTLAADYIEEQDEGSDPKNVPAMESVMVTLATLVQAEAAEVEPDEDETNSSAPEGESRGDAPSPESRDEQDPTEAPAEKATPKTDPIYSLEQGKRKPAWLLSQ